MSGFEDNDKRSSGGLTEDAASQPRLSDEGSDSQSDASRLAPNGLHEELAEKEEAIRILTAQLALKQSQLDRITGTLVWRLLSRYGRIKQRYLLPVYRLASRMLAASEGLDQNALREAGPEEPEVEPRSAEYDVICLPIGEWDSYLFQRSQQLLSQYAQHGYRVFYVSTRFQQVADAPVLRAFGRKIYGVQLPGPQYLNRGRDRMNNRMREVALRALNKLRERARTTRAVCIVEAPFWAPLALKARERWGWKLIYNCMDDYSEFWSSGPAVKSQEETLIPQADLVLATSRLLHEKVSREAKRTLLLPNAADFEHFSRPGPLRPLAHLPGPIIGYYGAIADWFDVDMIRVAAASRKEWQFVLIGEIENLEAWSLRKLGNVQLLGPQPYAALPGYLHQFDVACIPFLITTLTRAVNPVKFYEYLSAGKPVVAVELPDLEPYRKHFYAVRSVDDFVVQIEAALRERSLEKTRARVEFARRNTWLDRFKALNDAIERI